MRIRTQPMSNFPVDPCRQRQTAQFLLNCGEDGSCPAGHFCQIAVTHLQTVCCPSFGNYLSILSY